MAVQELGDKIVRKDVRCGPKTGNGHPNDRFCNRVDGRLGQCAISIGNPISVKPEICQAAELFMETQAGMLPFGTRFEIVTRGDCTVILRTSVDMPPALFLNRVTLDHGGITGEISVNEA